LRGEVLSEAGVKDITWITPLGKEASTEDWKNPAGLALGYVLSGAAGEFFTPGGQRDIDESFLVMMNAHSEELDFRFPILASPMSWEPLVDTAEPTGRVADAIRYEPGQIYRLQAHSFALFIDRLPRPMPPRRVPVVTGALLLDGAAVQERDRLL
jgi:glycogen operon protein